MLRKFAANHQGYDGPAAGPPLGFRWGLRDIHPPRPRHRGKAPARSPVPSRALPVGPEAYGAEAPIQLETHMTGASEIGLGFAVFAIGMASTIWTVVLTARFSRGGGAVESMLQRSFLPEKRGMYLALLSAEGSLLLLSGLLWGAMEAGWVPEASGSMGVAPFSPEPPRAGDAAEPRAL